VPDSIYRRPDEYDLEHVGDERDVRFWGVLLRRLGATRVLELGCGNGRVTLPLAQQEPPLELIGLDMEATMLDDARRKLGALPENVAQRVELVQGDMRAWTAAEPFDAVIIPCCSISHLLALDDQLQVWARAYAHLRPGGHFIVDAQMPDLPTLAESQGRRPRALVQLDLDREREDDGARLIRFKVTTYRAHEQRARVHFLYDRFEPDSDATRSVSDFDSHVYFPRELELLYRHAGFEIAARFGDYDGSPLRPSSPFMIVAGRKPEGNAA
jgi:SAM-dependent methyltransferase